MPVSTTLPTTSKMRVLDTVEGFRAACAAAARPLGLVPTMGALHDGHLALVRRARSENATAAASVFVNPAQFGPEEDFAGYPRDTDSDLAKLEAEGIDLVFAPATGEVYPEGFNTFVDVGRIGSVLEGASRPDHFRGVATVVSKLLAIARPDRAYFGQKDAQQCLVVRRLNDDLDLGAEIVVVPTVRDPDGLAISSRNAYLDDRQRRAAAVLYRSLRLARKLWESGSKSAPDVISEMRALFDGEPLASVEYVSIADARTLEELDRIDPPALVSLAVHIGEARLIDNIVLGETDA